MKWQDFQLLSAREPRSRLAPWVPVLLLGLLALLTFASGLGGGLVLDDTHAIIQHPVVQGRAPLLEAFKLSFWGESLDANPPAFRPLTTLSFAIDQRLLGGSALAFHVSSLLWYIALVAAVWIFARRCIGPSAGWLATALFVVMPVHVENVSSVVGRADTLGVLLSVLALLALSPTLIEGKTTVPWRLVLAALSFFAALLCKESMAVLPIVVALFVEFRRRTQCPLSILRAHWPSLAMLVSLGAYFAIRIPLQPKLFSYTAPDDVLVGAGLWEKIGYGLELLARYMGLIVAPSGLCPGRKFAEVFRPSHVSLAMIAGAALLGLGGYLSWRAYRRRGFPFVPAAFLAWFLVAGLVFAMPESMADRFLLLPSLFLCFAVGPWLQSFWHQGLGQRALILSALGVQVVLSMLQARTWHDEGTLWSHAVGVCPNSLHNHYRYADYLSYQGQTAEAVWHYAVMSKGRHAFPYAWSHPAQEEERTLPAERRLREMYHLLGFTVDESVWRSRFETYLRSLGKEREAHLFAAMTRQE